MSTDSLTVLFLCTGNSVRSIMAEAILNRVGRPRFTALSAGSHPTGTVNPLAMELLESLGNSTDTLRSKSWMEFRDEKSPHFDIVITVCDSAAESCPIWPGRPVQAHWSFHDPASVEGSYTERIKAFTQVYQELERCIQHLIKLPADVSDRERLKAHLDVLVVRSTQDSRGRQLA